MSIVINTLPHFNTFHMSQKLMEDPDLLHEVMFLIGMSRHETHKSTTCK